MSGKQLTVAELMARAAEEGRAKDAPRRRRRRSLDEGGVSVAELTGSIPKVNKKPAESKHSSVPIDPPEEELAVQQAQTARAVQDVQQVPTVQEQPVKPVQPAQSKVREEVKHDLSADETVVLSVVSEDDPVRLTTDTFPALAKNSDGSPRGLVDESNRSDSSAKSPVGSADTSYAHDSYDDADYADEDEYQETSYQDNSSYDDSAYSHTAYPESPYGDSDYADSDYADSTDADTSADLDSSYPDPDALTAVHPVVQLDEEEHNEYSDEDYASTYQVDDDFESEEDYADEDEAYEDESYAHEDLDEDQVAEVETSNEENDFDDDFDDDEELETEADEQGAGGKVSALSVFFMVILAIAIGAGLFKGFELLWVNLGRIITSVLAVAVSCGIVGIVHTLRTERDGMSMFLAGLAGLAITFGPLLLVQ